MLIILMIFLIFSSITVLIVKRNKETFYLFGMCISLAIMLSGISLYIAKKGGISRELQDFFFLTIEIKTRIQYFLITLDQLGFTIAVGRYLFPMFLLLLGLHYSMIPWLRRNLWVSRITFLIPCMSLIIYYPSVFRFITNNNPLIQQVIISSTVFWIVIFIIVPVFLLLYEAYSIRMKFFQRKFILITSYIFSISLLYLLYFGQDPAQVYQFYFSDFVWKHGIYYMNSTLSIPAYILIVLLNVIFAIIGFVSLLKYTHEVFETSRKEITIQRKFEAISSGTSVFVHSIKNQLLANRVIFKRINNMYKEDKVDINKLGEYTYQLSKQNENILLRIEELYRSVKTTVVHLVPIKLNVLIENSIERFQHKYPNKTVEVSLMTNAYVLADKMHLSEAIYNLLTNAQEAVNDSDMKEDGEVTVSCYNVRLYTVIEVKDNGVGISKDEIGKICEPFYTKKNSNYNWGMGLHYVRMIAKEHFGSLRFESKEGYGSTFYLLLPKFKE
jgi:signal transduction histidine kinase